VAELRPCPLCGAGPLAAYFDDRSRTWERCPRCDLVSVPPASHLSPERERAQYDLHQNDPSDAGYRRFLGRLAEPLLARLGPGSTVLDFGSGPGPTLSLMLAEAGHDVAIYDPFYAPDRSVFDRTYDAITATEVVEHLAQPGAELGALRARLRPGGLLGLMTRLRPPDPRFVGWHYRRDPTHIALFSEATMRWLARELGADLDLRPPDVAIFKLYR